jgi:hypothetical protein
MHIIAPFRNGSWITISPSIDRRPGVVLFGRLLNEGNEFHRQARVATGSDRFELAGEFESRAVPTEQSVFRDEFGVGAGEVSFDREGMSIGVHGWCRRGLILNPVSLWSDGNH